jgi:predicted O-methyltransferase YrrM
VLRKQQGSVDRGGLLFLDAVRPLETSVGYGCLGRFGDLGYEGKRVTVHGRDYVRALSSHPPARLVYRLDGRYTIFRCAVAINGDVPNGVASANFAVLVDGRPSAGAHVAAGERPKPLAADVSGAQSLELLVDTQTWEFCHAVWLQPELESYVHASRTLMSCLGDVEIEVPPFGASFKRCIATVVSPGFEVLLDDLLGSLSAYGNCPAVRVVVFVVNPDLNCKRVVAKHGATMVVCRSEAAPTMAVKSVLYSAAHVVNAEQFVLLDADLLIVGDLRPLFGALEACPLGSILACREGNTATYARLDEALCALSGGQLSDLARLLGTRGHEGMYPLVVNDGVFAATRGALARLDTELRGWTEAQAWVRERPDIPWRNQFLFNLGLARLDCGVELDPVYNVQLNSQEAQPRWSRGRLQAEWQDRHVRVLHFNGTGRSKYADVRGHFARISDPLSGAGDGDTYADFLVALRAFIGRRGLGCLTWSFYGTAEATGGQVRDPSIFPLLALLHYVIRANGCTRVLETGTARGVSAACLASAVCKRENGRVVTFDPTVFPERAELWDALPYHMQRSLEARKQDSLAGMQAAIERGERYEAALLDSLHDAEHVWAEFQLATRLVCAGGLILVHDACYERGTVPQALSRIRTAGYGVARLWAAEEGVREDDRLGLAVIENTRHAAHGV